MKQPDRGRPSQPGAALLNAALGHLQSCRIAEAQTVLRQVLAAVPDDPDAVHLLGLAALQQGQFAEAEGLLTRAAKLDRQQPAVWNNLGVALREQDKLTEAVAAYRKALAVAPDFSNALCNLGGALNRLGRPSEAIPALRRAIAQAPDHAEALNNLGSALFQQGALQEAESMLQRALRSAPRLAEGWNNLGNVLADLGRYDGAVEAYDKALVARPHYAEAAANLGMALHSLNKTDAAVAVLRRAIELRPGYEQAEAYLLHLLQIQCDWQGMAELAPRVDQANAKAIAEGRRSGETVFANVGRCDDPATNLAVAKSWADDVARRHAPLFRHGKSGVAKGDKPLVLGYVSSDLGEHAVGHLMRGQFRSHDRSRFRVNLYTKLLTGSPHRAQVISDCDRHADIDHMDPAEAARLIQGDGVDILIHLNGWTRHHSLAVCAHRPAPIQAEHVGFPGTTGADFMDYNIVDPIVAPQGHEAFYSEKSVHLPHGYQPNDNRQAISDKTMSRADCGLPTDGLVFASFNQSFKIDPLMFALWMRLLAAVPGSVLWLPTYEGTGETYLKGAAAAHGIDPGRLIFAPKLPKAEHLRRIQLVDLCLDTRIYTGHTTTSDVLWAGVPVVALRGKHFASLVPTSGLLNMGMAELVTDTLEDYESLALRLARDGAARAGLRAKIAANRPTAPLFDTPRFVRNLERAYQSMWEIYCTGDKPRAIAVADRD